MAANDIQLLPLHVACYSKSPGNARETVELLLSIKPDVAQVWGATGLPAHYAAEFSTAEVLQSILQTHPAAIYAACPDDNGNTPLLKAVASGNEDTVAYICASHPEVVRVANAQGCTALHLAAEGDSARILQLLHAAEPENIALADAEGRLPLYVFCEVHQEPLLERDREAECLRFLLRHYPAAVTAPSLSGETALSLCNPTNRYARRLLLRAQPTLHPTELQQLNYECRRMALFLACAAINADGIPSIFSRLRSADQHLLKLCLSFL
eukprot:gene28698-34646_t